MLHRIPLAGWFLVGAAVIGTVQTVHLGLRGWNPTTFIQVGADSPARARIERDFPELGLAPEFGHDGKYSYLMARDPAFWRARPETLTNLQDPGYRYARPLYPVLAGLGGQAPPAWTLAGLILIQTLAGGLCGAALAALARSQKLPAAFVLLNLANPGLSSSACLLTSDLLAHSLGLAAWCAVERRRFSLGIALFALSLLAKEYYALTPLALAAAHASGRRWRSAAALAILPLLPILGWKVALTAVLGPGGGQGNFDWPGAGIVETFRLWKWVDAPFGILGIAVVAGLLAAVCSRGLPLRLRGACGIWGLLALCASKLMWNDPTDLLRAIAPAWCLVTWAALAKPNCGRTA